MSEWQAECLKWLNLRELRTSGNGRSSLPRRYLYGSGCGVRLKKLAGRATVVIERDMSGPGSDCVREMRLHAQFTSIIADGNQVSFGDCER